METSVAGVEFIKKCEGCSLTEYDDVGHRAIGFGHDILTGEAFPNPITQEEADALLNKDLVRYETAVNRYLPLTQGQFDALVSFAYNMGIGSLQVLMSHGRDVYPVQVVRWINVRGKPNAAVLARREAELRMWLA